METYALNSRLYTLLKMKYNWKLLENDALFETLTELEIYLVESGHEDYSSEVHPISYIGKEPWEQRLYSELEMELGKDTWICDETTDDYKAKCIVAPDTQLGGEFSLDDAKKYCRDRPRLEVPEQFEFEKTIVKRWLNQNDRKDGRGKNVNSLKNLKNVKEKLNS